MGAVWFFLLGLAAAGGAILICHVITSIIGDKLTD